MVAADESDGVDARRGPSGRTGTPERAAGRGARRAQGRAGKRKPGASGDETPPDAATDAPPSFEAALQRLEEVVDRLEGGELELEAALASFEEGVRLTRQCAEQLDAAERRIEILMREGDDWVARPFGATPDQSGDAGDAED